MKIVDLGINGEGIARQDGKVYFVKGALVGEEVSVKGVSDKSKFSNCEVDKIIQKSGDRVDAPCPYFSICGGCQLQHLKYEKQLEYKQKLVKDTLKKVGGIEVDVAPCVESKNRYNYRNKSVFPAFSQGGHSQLGMFKENSKVPVAIEKCLIADEEINKVVKVTNDFLKDKHIAGFRYLVVRKVDKKLIITLVTEKKEMAYLKKYVQELLIHFKDFILNLNVNTDSSTILSTNFVNVYGGDYVQSETLGIKHKVNAGSFIQINDDVCKKLYSAVLENFDEHDTVVDAYCGAGLLSAMIARRAAYCYGVEISKSAIRAANDMQKENGIENLYFISGDCDKEVPSLLQNIEDEFMIVLDPPRKGCTQNVLQGILETKPKKIVYVSCNPITLAKDLKVLTSAYSIKKVQPFDMFPETVNVETLVVLEK